MRQTQQMQARAQPEAGAVGSARLAAHLRWVLACALLLTAGLEPAALPSLDPARWPLFAAYALYSLAIAVGAQRPGRWARHRLLHWLDLPWCAAMVCVSGGSAGWACALFLPGVLSASLGWGRAEGGRLLLASVAAFLLGAWLAPGRPESADLLLRSGLLLGLGQGCALWGHHQFLLQGRLALLSELSRAWQDRQGAERSLQHVLRSVLDFHGATACLLVLRDSASGQTSLRSLQDSSPDGAPQEDLGPAAAAALLPFETEDLVLRCGGPLHATHCLDQMQRWQRAAPAAAQQAAELAELLEARSFISLPLALRQGQGRLHVCRKTGAFSRDEAVFLRTLAEQAFGWVDHVHRLERLRAQAAVHERQKLALDLHDTAVQPYIGLKLGLSALRLQAGPDNPLLPGLQRLEDMASQVAEDLRRYARQVRQPQRPSQALAHELRQQAAQVRDFYGVDIDVRIPEELAVSESLSAEVLQVVREGLTNICKHTQAQRGEVELRCQGGWLGIRIANEGGALDGAADFTPRSISERAAALGGRIDVRHEHDGRTAVHVHVPV